MTTTRRVFLTTLGGGALAARCGRRAERALILRLSHSMTAGNTALHVFGERFSTASSP